MTVNDNKEALQRVYAAMRAHDLAALAALIDSEFVHPIVPDARGPEGFVQVFGMFLAAFPDFGLTVADMIAEGDKVAARGSITGTHTGDYMGIPATGRTIDIGIIEIWQFANGKAIANWVQMDMLSMMQQLGVAPAPG
jgi:steroid delta-isomerase-like uncharacterized protein